jgi:SET domain-containing protein
MEIQKHNKIQVKKSPIHGWGVFATEDIKEGELIEECLFLRLPVKRGETNYTLFDYTFVYPKGENWVNHIIALGYGSLYNHSETPNATWEDDLEKETIRFIALKPIGKDEEIVTYYGDENYWSDGRSHIDLK